MFKSDAKLQYYLYPSKRKIHLFHIFNFIFANLFRLIGFEYTNLFRSAHDSQPTKQHVDENLDSQDDILRERSLNALGRIGRTRFETVKPYWEKMFGLATDNNPRIRLSFIWASENIATNTPDPYQDYVSLYAKLLHDSDDKVRMEAPEIFRVLGKRRPQIVKPYLDSLKWLAENDPHPVVRIHSAGAIRVIK